MELRLIEAEPTTVRAAYTCPCGCTPSVAYARDAAVVEEGCCCGNEFAVGPKASASLSLKAGFRPETKPFDAPWGEPLEAAWLVGPSVHGASGDPEGVDHQHADQVHVSSPAVSTIDPVCSMTVEPESAGAKGLHSAYEGTDYFFCGRGCKLEFDDDPDRYLDPSSAPSM